MNDYLQALSQEAEQYSQASIETVYVGGGTPTLLNAAQLEILHAMITKNFKTGAVKEWSVETNPDSIDFSKAKLLRDLGFNRISLGAQTFDPAYLKFLGRTHRREDIYQSFDVLRKAGFENINVDMMFGFPGQSLGQLKKDLAMMTKLNSDHLSIYNLSIENNSLFHRLKLSLPSSDQMALFYRLIISDLDGHGFEQYEISNFSKPHRQSAHNMLYWECQDYIGLGMAAHSHVDGKRFWNHQTLFSYLKNMRMKGSAVEGREALSTHRKFTEALLFGLRMNKGVCVKELQERFGSKISARQEKQMMRFIDHGFLKLEKGILATTLQGRLVLDELCGYLI